MSGWLLRGARVLDPARGVDAVADLRIEDGRIAGIGARLDAPGARVVSLDGAWLLPGLVEPRARIGGDGARFTREVGAAAAGGYTALALVPDPAAAPDAELAARTLRAGPAGGAVRLYPLAALVGEGTPPPLAELGLLRAAGCVGAVQAGRTPPAAVLRRALEYAAGQGLAVLLDAQDEALAAGGCAHEGEVAARLGLSGVPVAAEELGVARAVTLAGLTGARAHCTGLSSGAGAAALRAARAAGLAVSADTGLWHLVHTHEALGDFDAVFHLQPPLRTSADRAALREALAQGLLAVSADHRAHGADAKAAPFARTAPGAAGFEAVLPVLAALVREEAIGLAAALGAVTHLPASLLGIPGGTLAPGASADLCVYDPAREWTVGPDTWRSAGTATPVWGRTLRGRVLATLAGGATVHDPQGLFA